MKPPNFSGGFFQNNNYFLVPSVMLGDVVSEFSYFTNFIQQCCHLLLVSRITSLVEKDVLEIELVYRVISI